MTTSHKHGRIGSEMVTNTAPLCVQSEQGLLEDPDRLTRCFLGTDIGILNRLENEENFFFAVNKYLDVDCDDEILYLDSTPDDFYSYWRGVIENKFCLTNPIDVCYLEPKTFECVQIGNNVPIRSDKLYDKIIIKNCLKIFENRENKLGEFFLSRLKDQTQQRTSILIVQRVSDLNTLPYSEMTRREWAHMDIPYTRFMETLQRHYFTLNYDIEVFRTAFACKSAWFERLNTNSAYPIGFQLEPRRRLEDIRELNENVFKYQPFDECVELTDRMLFIGAYRPLDRQSILIQRIRSMKNRENEQKKLEDDIMMLHLEMAPDMRALIKKKAS